MKTKILTFLIAFAFLATNSFAQTPEIKWWFDLDDSSFGNAAAADIDNDGNMEIVFGCYRNDGFVYALNGEDGSLLWKKDLSIGSEGCNDAAPLIYDVDKDGALEVIVASSCNPSTYCFDAATGNIEWQTPLHGSDSPPSISDVDNDGKPEILHGNFNGSVSCLNGEDGTVAWEKLIDPDAWIQTAPTILDADNDGQLDFVVASWSLLNNHKIYCYRADNQQLLWESSLPNDVIYHGASVADLDEDGKMELVIGCYDGSVYALNAENGTSKWYYSFTSPFYVAAPISIADLNGDDKFEIVFFDFDKIGVLKHSGSLLWSKGLEANGQSFRGAAISDINGDQMLDIVFGTSNGKLKALNGSNGQLIWEMDLATHYGNTAFNIDHGPVIADFDKDGSMDIFLVGGHSEYPEIQNNFGRAYVISTNSAGGPDWPMFRRDSVRSGHVPLGLVSKTAETFSTPKSIEAFPNPSSGEIKLSYQIEEKSAMKISIFDVHGRQLAILKSETAVPGDYNLKWNTGKTHAPGIYFCYFESDGETTIKKLVLIN